MHSTVCPGCQRKVALPDNTTSRTVKTMCPKCGELLPVPPSPSRHPQDSVLADLQRGHTGEGLRQQLAEAMASLRNLGLLVLGMGLVALLLSLAFCISDYLAYVGLPVAVVGALLGLYGIGRAVTRRETGVLYVLGGLATCVLALVLIFMRLGSRTTSSDGEPADDSSIYKQRQKLE